MDRRLSEQDDLRTLAGDFEGARREARLPKILARTGWRFRHMIQMLASRNWWVFLLRGGIVAILIGILTFLNPGATALVLVIYIGALWIVRGIAEVVTAITLRKMIEGEWLYILIGVVSVLVGLYLIVFPGDGAIALLWLIGFYAIFAGIMYLAMAFRLRSIGSPGASPA